MKTRRPVTHRIVGVSLCLLASCSLVCGCGDSSSDRMSVQGTVTLDNQPLEKGVISFLPLPGTDSPTAGADVVAGQFEVPSGKGVFPGKFSVTITASLPTGKKIPDPRFDQMVDELEQYLPIRYNTASELEVNIERGAAK